MTDNTSHQLRNYALVGTIGALGGVATRPLIQNLVKNVLPALASTLVALLENLTGGAVMPINSCGVITGGEVKDVNIYCDDVNISQTLTVAVESNLTYIWNQAIENSLRLDIASNNTISNTSITSLFYKLSQISKLTETPLEPDTSCFLPETELVSDPSDWRFSEPEVKKKLWQ